MPDTMSPDQIALAIEESEPPLKHSTVVIADRHALYREALANMLDAQGDFRVVGQATNPTNTLNACAEIRPDIMVLDIELLGSRSQVESLARFISASPSTCILVVTMLDDPDLVNEVLNLGVRGYLHKTATGMEIVTALVAIRSNRERVVVSVPRSCLFRPQSSHKQDTLSQRESQVLTMVAEAMSNRQIATRLHITEGTVKRHMRSIFGKLHAVSRIDAVNKAVAASLIPGTSGQR